MSGEDDAVGVPIQTQGVLGMCPRCKEAVWELEAHKYVTVFHGASKYERVMHMNCVTKESR